MAECKTNWQIGKCVTDCLDHMLQHEIQCDVAFQIKSPDGTVTTQPAHKVLLMARSPVFEAMFGGQYAESSGEVVIVDIEKVIFKDLLRYIYTDCIDLIPGNVLPVLYASKKYILEGLEKKCMDYLDEILNPENVCQILSNSLTYEFDSCVEKCLQFIATRIPEVCTTEEFVKMPREALLKLLQSNKLYSGNEVELYRASVRWARNKIGITASDKEIRECLGECFYQVRFSLIKPVETFASEIANSNVLTDREIRLFYGVILNAQGMDSEILSEIGFNLRSRLHICKMFDPSLRHQLYKIQDTEGTEIVQFSCDKPIKLIGISVFLGRKDTKSKIDLQCKIGDASDPAAMITTQRMSDGRAKPVPVRFDAEVDVPPDVKVNIQASVRGCIGYGTFPDTAVIRKETTFHIKRQQLAAGEGITISSEDIVDDPTDDSFCFMACNDFISQIAEIYFVADIKRGVNNVII